jgi:hypothetical protein
MKIPASIVALAAIVVGCIILQEHHMQALPNIVALAFVWFGCSLINLIWLKHYPDVIATEFRSALIVLAPLATFFVVFGLIGCWLYSLPQRALGVYLNKI